MSEVSRKDFLKSAAMVSAGYAAATALGPMTAFAEDAVGFKYQGGSNMKIAKVEAFLTDRRWCYVKVTTENGEYGWGETGCWAWQEAVVPAVKALEKLIIGKDPFKIEWIYQGLTRAGHFRGQVINSAISAIDIALWDLKGKALGVPIYELLGGAVRNKVKIYDTTTNNKTPEDIGNNVKALWDEGWQYVRIRQINPAAENGSNENSAEKIRINTESFQAIRDIAGWDVNISFESHRGLKPVEAIELGKRVDKYLCHFYEDPVLDSLAIQKYVSANCLIPIATGERNVSVEEHQALLDNTDVRYLRPDMCVIGGITAGKKVASMAEHKGVGIIPHNPLGPISTMAAMQIDMNIPNFEVQEWPRAMMTNQVNDYLKEPAFEVKDGYCVISDRPGLGLDLVDDFQEKFPFTGASPRIQVAEDGSPVDR